jgi:hypothetical protein
MAGVSGPLEYHSENFSNIPCGFVYADISAEYGEEWSEQIQVGAHIFVILTGIRGAGVN